MNVKTNKFSLLVTIIIFILSTIPVPEVPGLENVRFIDKWVHFVMYGSLTFALYLDRKLSHSDTNITFITIAFLFPTIYGGIMELIQAYCTTCRSGDWLDFYADAFGAFLSTIISLALWKVVKISVQK